VASNDTGNGGFELDNKTYTFSNVPEGEPGEQPRESNKGNINVDKSPRDIGETVKITIGQYLSDKTKVNSFKIDSKQVKRSITDENGFPSSVENENTEKFSSNQPKIINQIDLRGSEKTLEDPSVNLSIKKGRASGNQPDGHVLLPSIQKDKQPETVSRYVNTILGNNRFNAASLKPQANFVNGVNTTTDVDRHIPHKPPADYNEQYNHPKLGEISAKRLAQVGAALSIRSSAEIDSSTRNNDPTSFGAEAKALLPSANQIGLSRIDQVRLEAHDVLESLTQREIPENDVVSIAPGGSWGSLNNVHDQFSGVNSLGMIALSATVSAGVFLIYEGLSFLINIINAGPKTLGKTSSDSFVLGRSTVMPRNDPSAFPPDNMLDVGSLLGIRQTVHPFKQALDAGTAAFFGVDNSGNLLNQLGQSVVSSTRSPGFNVIVARTIIRSGTLIIDKFKNIGGNPLSVVQGILSVADEIRTSKLISVMNVFAALGDQLLIDEESNDQVNEPGQPIKKSRIDSENDDAFARNVVKNRLSGGLKLAWASNRSPAMYLLPDSTMGLTAVPGIGALNSGIGLQHDKAKVFYKLLTVNDIQQRGARIPYDSTNPNDVTVKGMEQRLEAEYVPFYLHDLRTNEIISFHAFITSLTDSFTPNWESMEGFGRVDPVVIYKNTSRKVSVSFFIASTSEEDFKDMWVKVNKLVSMVYPQYTKGRTLSTPDGNSKIIQPFSQLMSASPLVRLRIGDVIRSNYSRFALSRLFGADTNEMVLNGSTIKFEGLLNEFKKKLQDALKNKNENYTWSIQTDNLSLLSEGSTTVRLPSVPGFGGINKGNKFAPTFQVDKHDIKFFEFKIAGEVNSATKIFAIIPSIMSKQEMFNRFGLNTSDIASIDISLKKKYDNAENASRRVVGGTYVVHSDNLVPTTKTINSIKDEILTGDSEFSESVTQLTDFLNPDKNAVVKSFQETRGKGLAGKIDQLDFDFFDNVVWETEINQRAPKFFKVNMSFTPIHDISPGLDHQGYNRSPVYPLGHFVHDRDDVKSGQ